MLPVHQTPVGSKVERAKEHLAELEREIKDFLATEPFRIETRPDPKQTNCFRYFVASVPPSQPISIPLIAGDVLFNLRASLDHLVYQLALDHGTRDAETLRRTAFPIYKSAESYAEYSRKKQMKGMSEAVRVAIDAVKPYKGGNDLLWQLHELNNLDKHRLLLTVGAALGWHSLPVDINRTLIDTLTDAHAKGELSDWEDVMGSHTPSEILSVNVRPAIRKCPLKIGDELRLAWDDPAIHQKEEIQFTFEVAFAEPEITQSQPVLGTLRQMATVVDEITKNFKPFLES